MRGALPRHRTAGAAAAAGIFAAPPVPHHGNDNQRDDSDQRQHNTGIRDISPHIKILSAMDRLFCKRRFLLLLRTQQHEEEKCHNQAGDD